MTSYRTLRRSLLSLLVAAAAAVTVVASPAALATDASSKPDTSDIDKAIAEIKTWPVRIKAVDAAKQPLVQQDIVLEADTPLTARTDDYGVAVFAGVPAGKHDVTYRHNNQQYSQSITVKPSYTVVDDKPIVKEQTFTVHYNFTQPNYSWVLWAILAGALLLAFIATRLARIWHRV